MAEDAQIPYNCVAWTLLEGYPWSPVYVFDPNQVRENLELLGNSHQHHLKKARDWPNVYRLVYNFGYHNISLLSLGQYIKPWQCPDHLRFLNGYPHECMNRRDVVEAFREALIEAQAFLATDNRSRMLPNMTVSDFYYDDQQPVVPAPVPSILSTPPPLPIAYQVHSSSHSSGALTDDTGPEPSSLGQSGSSITGRPENLAPTTSATVPPQEQPTIPLRRTRARTQLDRDSSASQDKGVPGLPPAPDAAKQLRSPQDTMKPTRQSAKAKTSPTKPPKQVDGRSTRKPKLPLPPSQEVKRPAAAAAKKTAARPKGPKKGNNPAISPPSSRVPVESSMLGRVDVGPHKAISTSRSTTTPPRAYEKQTGMLTLRHDGLDNAPTVPQLYPNHLMTLAEVSSSPPVDIPNNSIVWAHVHGMSWWPAIVLDPFQVKPVLHFLGHAHDAPLKKARKQPKDVRLVFVFGRYVFCSLKKKMKRWQCPEHDTFLQGPTSLFTAHPFLADVFADGVHQAQNFLGAQTLNQYIPYVHASDLSSTTVLPPPQVQFNAVAWAKRDEVWWPVFLCDPRTLRSNLFHLGTGELPHCRVATGLPFHNRIAYYFGMHDFGLYADDSLLKRWFCSEHVSFIKGHVDASVTDRLKDALKQVQEFFVAEEGHRTMLCKLVGASDDVSSPSPPPQLHSFLDGATVVPASHQVVLALYRPSSNPTRKAMLDDGAADKAPYDVLTMHTTRFKPTDLDALNQIMNAPTPQRPADEKHGLTPMLPFLSDQVDATEVQVSNEHIDAVVVQVLHNLVDAIAQYHAATNDIREAIEEVDTPTPLVQTDETHEATLQEDSDANDMQEPDESHRSIQYAMDDIVASIEAIQCEDQEIEAMRSAAKTDDGAVLVEEGDWCVDMNSVAWGRKSEHHPWWPVYSCDPRRLRSHLHYMGVRHRGLLLQARRHAATLRLVYYFGRHTFGVTALPLKLWNSRDHSHCIARFPGKDHAVDIFADALHEAEACHTSNEAVPFVTPWDVNLSRIPPTAPPPAVVCSSVAWSFESGSTWWPVYLCDPDAIGPAFCLGTEQDDRLLRIATYLPEYYVLVYFFGTRRFGLRQRLALTNGWLGFNHQTCIDSISTTDDVMATKALAEAEDFARELRTDLHKLPFELVPTAVSSVEQALVPPHPAAPPIGGIHEAQPSHLESYWRAEQQEDTKDERRAFELRTHRDNVSSFFKHLMRQDEDGSSSSSDSSRFEDDSDDEEPESCDTEWEHSDHDSPRRSSASVAYAKETKGFGRSKSPSWFAEKHPSYPRTQGITTTSSPDPPASRSRTRGPVTSVGIPRTAHVWKHFVWEEHMGKYYNYKLIECRYCRQAYADRGDRDVPVPERVVSQIPKMKLHLLQCAHCQLTEDDLEPLQKQGKHRATVVKAAPSRPPEDPRPGRALGRTLAVDDDVDEDQSTISATREEGAAAATIEPVAPQGPLLVASTADGVDIPSVEEPGANDDDAASNSFEHQVFAPESPRQPDPSPIAKVGLKKASPGRKKRKASHVIVVEDDSDTLSDESVASYTARHPVKKRKGVPAKTLGPRTITLSDADKARMTKQRFILPAPPQLAFGPHLSQDDALPEKEVPQPPIVTASPEHVKPPAPSVPVTRKAVAVPPAAPVAVTRKAVVSVPPTPAPPTNVPSDVPVTKVSALHDTIVWAYLKGYPWVPAYVLNPFKLRSELHLLGNGHERTLKKAKQKPGDYCIIYYFGTHNFGLITTPATALRPWHCDEHAKFLSGFPKAACKGDTAAELVDAIAEAVCFEAADKTTRLLPYMVASDTDPTLPPPEVLPVPVDSMAWAISQGFPWMPVYVCDTSKLRANLHFLGDDHCEYLDEAKASPNTRLVYYFGSHCFGTYKMDGSLKPWNCPDHDSYLTGQSSSVLYIKPDILAEFQVAMAEVEEYLSVDAASRVLPEMHPSDMNPLLDPPSDSESGGADSDATVSDVEDIVHVQPKRKESSIADTPKQQITPSKKESPAQPKPSEDLADDIIVIDSSDSENDRDDNSASSEDEPDSSVHSTSSMSDVEDGDCSTVATAAADTKKNAHTRVDAIARSRSLENDVEDEEQSQVEDSEVSNDDGLAPVNSGEEFDKDDEAASVRSDDDEDGGGGSWEGSQGQAPDNQDELEALEDLEDAEYFTNDDDPGEDDPPDGDVEDQDDGQSGGDEDKQSSEDDDAQEETLNDVVELADDSDNGHNSEEDAAADADVDDDNQSQEDDLPVVSLSNQRRKRPNKIHGLDNTTLMKVKPNTLRNSASPPPSQREELEADDDSTQATANALSARKTRKSSADDTFRSTRRRQLIVLDDSDDSDVEPAKPPRSHKKRVRDVRSSDEDKPSTSKSRSASKRDTEVRRQSGRTR